MSSNNGKLSIVKEDRPPRGQTITGTGPHEYADLSPNQHSPVGPVPIVLLFSRRDRLSTIMGTVPTGQIIAKRMVASFEYNYIRPIQREEIPSAIKAMAANAIIAMTNVVRHTWASTPV